MRALVIYDSTYGNTQRLAEAIAATLQEHAEVTLVAAGEAPDLDWGAVDLLVVGGPTQGHGVSAPLRALLDRIPDGALQGVTGAAFDTRFHLPGWLTGSAAQGIAHRLHELGATVLLPPESFYIAHSEGPLQEGELERATHWARLTPAGVVERRG